MRESISRRNALLRLALLVGATGMATDGVSADAAEEPPHLKLDDPTAVALGYHLEASQVDPKQFANYKAGEKCSNCLQLQGQAGQAWRPCTLFPGKLVNADGWCRVWVKRS